MEPNVVLRRYLQLLAARSLLEVESGFASNGAIDWYGRTIKGPHRILSFIRTDSYVHSFYSPRPCGEFEFKDAQLQTRKIPPENLIPESRLAAARSSSSGAASSCDHLHNPPSDDNQEVPSTSSNFSNADKDSTKFTDRPISKGFETPPPVSMSKEDYKLPEVGQGRRFLDLSDDELDQDRVVSVSDQRKTNFQSMNEFAEKLQTNSELLLMSDEEEEQGGDSSSKSAKKRQLTFEIDSSFQSSLQEEESGISSKKAKLLVPSGSVQTPLVNTYSELKYLEVSGAIKMTKKIKHRGIHGASDSVLPVNTQFDQVSDPDDDLDDRIPQPQPTCHNYWQRNTRLRISYRENRFFPDQIQFVLICYEHLSRRPTTRRNLMVEFGQDPSSETTPRTKSRTKSSATKTTDRLTPHKDRKKSTPKSLRF